MPEHLTTQPNTDTEPRAVTLPLDEWHALLRLLIGKAPIYCAFERGRFVASIASQLASEPAPPRFPICTLGRCLRFVESWLTTQLNRAGDGKGPTPSVIFDLREAARAELSTCPLPGTVVYPENPHP